MAAKQRCAPIFGRNEVIFDTPTKVGSGAGMDGHVDEPVKIVSGSTDAESLGWEPR
jgi:hypothetical protein